MSASTGQPDIRSRPPTRATVQLQPIGDHGKITIAQHIDELTKGVPRFLSGCVFFLENTGDSTDMLKGLLKKLGATVLPVYKDSCTHLLTPYQKGIFHKALEDKRMIVTTEWLEDCVNVHGVVPQVLTEYYSNKIYNPIYYPVKHYHIPGSAKYKFTLTGFKNIEKRRLTYLILATGAQCTGNMTKDNTHLIYRHKDASDKYHVAGQWGIRRVMKEWLYESVRQWRFLEPPAVDAVAPTITTSNEVNENNKRPIEQAATNGGAETKRAKLDPDNEDAQAINAVQGENFVLINRSGSEVADICRSLKKQSVIYYSGQTEKEFPHISQYIRGEVDKETVLAEGSAKNSIVELNEEHIRSIQDQVCVDRIMNQKVLIVAPFDKFKSKQDGIFKPRSTGIVYDARMCLHDGPYPESPLRISAIWNILEENHLTEKCFVMKSREATLEELITVHSKQYVSDFFCLEGQFNPKENNKKLSQGIINDEESILHDESTDIRVNEYTLKAARLSAGGVIKMCEKVVEGHLENGFAVVRPPGHHARAAEPMGFCFFNNVAVAARVIQNKYPKLVKKVIIVDFDIHHGNGTQEIFENDPSVLYISMHRIESDYFPGTGHMDEIGTEKGVGYTINIPLPPKNAKMGPLSTINDSDYMTVFHHLICPIALEFSPDLVIVSAGFDAAKGDLLGKRMALSPSGFAQMTAIMKTWANGKIVLALEGGYNVDVTAQCAMACLKVLLGSDPPAIQNKPTSAATHSSIRQVMQHHSKYWKCFSLWSDWLQSPSTQSTEINSNATTSLTAGQVNNASNTRSTRSSTSLSDQNQQQEEVLPPVKKKEKSLPSTSSTSSSNIDPNAKIPTKIITIGSTSCDYTNIDDALSACTTFSPTAEEHKKQKLQFKQTIEIQIHPGEYKLEVNIGKTLLHKDIVFVGQGSKQDVILIGAQSALTQSIKSLCFKNLSIKSHAKISHVEEVESMIKVGQDKAHMEMIDCELMGITVSVEAGCSLDMKNCDLSFSRRGIAIQTNAEANLSNNKIHHNHIGVLTYVNGNINAKENSISDNKEYGFLGYCPKGVLEKNLIFRNGLSGIQMLQGSLKVCHNEVFNQFQAGIVMNNNCCALVENNKIYGNTYSGIECGLNSRAVIRSNEIYNGKQSGILIVTKAGGVIENNKIYSNGYAGVEVREGNPNIKNNQIYNQMQAGVGIHGGQSLSVVEGNNIYGNEYANLEVKSYGNPVVQNNKIHHGKQHGILVFECGRGKYENNQVYENTFDGVNVQSNGLPYVANNNISKNCKNGISIGPDGKGTYEKNHINANKENGVRVLCMKNDVKVKANEILNHRDPVHGYAIYAVRGTEAEIDFNTNTNNRGVPPICRGEWVA
ncbi:histone deacetylase [Acrasis kona]|uniref:histone deacetylase n=1 Tax=Acrasis kona TaxID=1008807 RepID=A0AAW2YK46_9EUKA